MRIKRSLDRISWRLSKPIAFKPNQKDVEALNEIVEYIASKEKQQLIDNQLLGKLYIYLFGEFVKYYKSSVTDEIPQKELSRILNKDIRLIVEEFRLDQNAYELSKHIEAGFPLAKFKPMEYKEVSENLRIMVNAAINTFGPKHLEKVKY